MPKDTQNKNFYSKDYTKITQEQLDEILENHRIWIESNNKNGTPADLSNKNLCELNFEGAELSRIIFNRSNLFKAVLSGANLEGATFNEANLTEANFFSANLKDANLKSAHGLSFENLAGCDLTRAGLPDSIKYYEPIKIVEDSSKNAKKIFSALIIVCIYSLIIIGTTKDASIFTNSVTSTLPLIGVSVPILVFFFSAPIILLLFQLYFQLYLQRHWENIYYLPAKFPDGRPLYKVIYPWLLNGVIYQHFYQLRHNLPRLANFQTIFLDFIIYMFPAEIPALFLIKYSSQKAILPFAYLLTMTVISFFAGSYFLIMRNSTFRLQYRDTFYSSLIWYSKRLIFIFLIPIVLGALLLFLYSPNQTFRKTDLSNANFEWLDLSGVNLYNTKLINSNLKGVDLTNANLRSADLRGSNIKYAVVKEANFQEANLIGVKGLSPEFHQYARNTDLALYDSDYLQLGRVVYNNGHNQHILDKDLSNYNFKFSNLDGADFYGYNLKNTNFGRSNLNRVIFKNANLKGANLKTAINLSVESLNGAIVDSTTILPKNILDSLKANNDTTILNKLKIHP
ncbi:MAG: pentapeptide repeat-containing protein [Candidatus Hodarchaeales archaeon]|jgi:uncharacterized protein YjbI with pentapeptide repeats